MSRQARPIGVVRGVRDHEFVEDSVDVGSSVADLHCLIPSPGLHGGGAFSGVSKPARQFRHRSVRIRRSRSEVVVKYMILIQSNPQFLERWEALPKGAA